VFRVILHLDMDAFYASVEQRDDPGLRGRPVIVGSPPTQRGVVCAASYEARKFGVRSAMPSAVAGRLCPTGIFVRPHMDHYREESRHIMQIVAETGAVVEPMSIDEAYLDVSSVSQAEDIDASLLKAMPLARHVKQRILSERKLTATIGIASNKLLAKIASDHKKPDGLTVISDREKVSFLRPLQVRVLYGVGKVTEQVLNQADIVTIGDLQDYAGDLRALVGSTGRGNAGVWLLGAPHSHLRAPAPAAHPIRPDRCQRRGSGRRPADLRVVAVRYFRFRLIHFIAMIIASVIIYFVRFGAGSAVRS
jgi:DNA polymerase-4